VLEWIIKLKLFKRSKGGDKMSQKNGEIDIPEELRSELTGYCYRMMGSIFEAEDAVQDTCSASGRTGTRFVSILPVKLGCIGLPPMFVWIG
jgi:hypothetical protein